MPGDKQTPEKEQFRSSTGTEKTGYTPGPVINSQLAEAARQVLQSRGNETPQQTENRLSSKVKPIIFPDEH